MRKTKEVLRLHFELGLRQREIARACSISQGAVHNYLKKAAAAGITWPLPEGWDEKRIEEALFGEQRPVDRLSGACCPDFPTLHEELQRHRHLTLQLAWEEYRQTNPDGYRYSRFCELCTSGGAGSRMWFCARSTSPARKVSSTGPVQRFRCTIRLPARSGQRRCS